MQQLVTKLRPDRQAKAYRTSRSYFVKSVFIEMTHTIVFDQTPLFLTLVPTWSSRSGA
jgi:hypothetical protein